MSKRVTPMENKNQDSDDVTEAVINTTQSRDHLNVSVLYFEVFYNPF